MTFLVACNKQAIFYKYAGTVITRIDVSNAETHFYLGEYNNTYPQSYIKVTYHGIDAGMDGYLIFLPNRKVDVVGCYGLFEKVGNDTNLCIRDFIDNGFFMRWEDSINGKYNNIIRIANEDNSYERKENLEGHSKVQAIYGDKK